MRASTLQRCILSTKNRQNKLNTDWFTENLRYIRMLSGLSYAQWIRAVTRTALKLAVLFLALLAAACTNISGASKSSTSLSNFLGFSELPEWYVDARYHYPDSEYRDNDFGLPIHYRDVGEGDTIVLVHGELSSLHAWDSWIELLKQDYRVIAIDLPGSGLTGSPSCIEDPDDLCPDNLSEDYISHTLTYLIEDLRLRNFHLVGASFGGYLAAKYALSHPQKVKSLTLISPLGFQQEPPFMVSYLSNTSLVSEFFQPSSYATTIVNDWYGDPNNITQDRLQRYIHLLQAPEAHETNIIQVQIVENLMERGTEERFSDLETRTLIMWGEEDQWGRFEHAQRWAEEISNSMVVAYRNVGHLSMEEHAEDSAYDLIAFFKEEPLPSIEGLGNDAFTIQDAVEALGDKADIFAPNREISEQMEDVE
jgi:pimeloyl-ACP methyl ester carboxylesterase